MYQLFLLKQLILQIPLLHWIMPVRWSFLFSVKSLTISFNSSWSKKMHFLGVHFNSLKMDILIVWSTYKCLCNCCQLTFYPPSFFSQRGKVQENQLREDGKWGLRYNYLVNNVAIKDRHSNDRNMLSTILLWWSKTNEEKT